MLLRKYKTEILLFSTILIGRLVFLAFFYPAFGEAKFLAGDGIDYIVGAQNLRDHGIFSIDTAPPLRPTISYTPGYSVFLLLSSFGTLSLLPILIVQHIIGTLGALLVFKIGLLLFSRHSSLMAREEPKRHMPAALAALLFGLEPGTVFFSSQIFTETLYTTLFLGTLYLALRWSASPERPNLPYMVFSGGILGIATFVRPSMVYMAPLLLLFVALMYFYTKNSANDKSRIRTYVLTSIGFAATFLLVITPWIARNYKHFGYAQFSSLGGYVMATRNIPAYFSWKERLSPEEGLKKTKEYFTRQGINENVFGDFETYYDPRLEKESLKIIKRDPLGFVMSQKKFLIPYFFGTGWSEIVKVFDGNRANPPDFHNSIDLSVLQSIRARGGSLASTATIVGSIFFGFIYIFSVLGAWSGLRALWRTPNSPMNNSQRATDTLTALATLLFLAIIVFFAFSTGPLSYSRYRFPVNPLIFLLGSFGLSQLLGALKTSKDK